MATTNDSIKKYNPPTGRLILEAQDKPSALRLLIAQRRLYSRSKRWLGLRLIGMGLIALIAPIVTLLWPNISVVIGAVAGAWLFFGRTIFLILEKKVSSKGAAVQELFDMEVFRMPSLGERSPVPTLEEITALSGPDNKIQNNAKKAKLLGWYAINSEDSGTTSVAICQRTNAAYSGGLLKTTARIWLNAIVLWAVFLIFIGVYLNFSLGTFLLGIFLPLLPAYLDTFKYWQEMRVASTDRESLSNDIQEKLESNNVSGEDLLIWQTKMYDLRRDVPQVPDFIYTLMRNRNERIMKSVATQLSDKSSHRKEP